MKLSDFKQDKQKAHEGIVHTFDSEGKCYVRVARWNNPKFEAELRRLMEPHKNTRRSKVKADVVDTNTKKAMAKCILLEMVGFDDDQGDITGTKGAPIPDTEENRFKILDHADYGEFRDLVSTISMNFDNFKVANEEEEVGNSETTSAGPGRGDEKKPSSDSSKS